MQIKRLLKNAVLPTRGSEYAAGWDLYAALDEPVHIPSHETFKIDTGISVAIPEHYFGAIYARSGLSIKRGLRPANCVGVIDSDYRGSIIVALYNDSDTIQTVNPGDRIAQLVLLKYYDINLEEVNELDSTERGENGLGSTGR